MLDRLKGLLKVMFALAIPLGIACFWWYSQQEANREVEEYKKFQKEHPSTDKVTVDNYQLKEVDDADHIRWQLLAKRGTIGSINSSKDVLLDDVVVQYFDKESKQVKLRLSAPAGIANEQTQYVKLNAVKDKPVLAEGESGKARMEAQKVELKKKNQFVASGGVNIVWPGVAKVSGSTATGSLEKNADLKNFKIAGNTHALLGRM